MEIIIVTGLSGAGKSQAIKGLEDKGYYCVDNMPLALMKNFFELALKSNMRPDKIAFVVDVRATSIDEDMEIGLRKLFKMGLDVKVIFLEASNEVVVRRYSETRRIHPITKNSPSISDIENERKRLKEIRQMADFIIDTSHMKGNRLKREIENLLTKKKEEETFLINIQSFGYKHGIPIDADIVIDMRFIPNPFYVKTLKNATGNSKKVREYVMKHKEAQEFIKDFSKLINGNIPLYKREGKYHLNIAFGCTGGQHRSVAMANEFFEIFEKQGKQVTLEHRDIKRK